MDGSEKTPTFLVRELAVGAAASPMGTEALPSASGSHKAEAGEELTLPISLQLLWLPPSGTESLGASEKLWHYAGS